MASRGTERFQAAATWAKRGHEAGVGSWAQGGGALFALCLWDSGHSQLTV